MIEESYLKVVKISVVLGASSVVVVVDVVIEGSSLKVIKISVDVIVVVVFEDEKFDRSSFSLRVVIWTDEGEDSLECASVCEMFSSRIVLKEYSLVVERLSFTNVEFSFVEIDLVVDKDSLALGIVTDLISVFLLIVEFFVFVTVYRPSLFMFNAFADDDLIP